MVIGDIRPQDPSNQHQEIFPNNTTQLIQGLNQNNHEQDVEPND
jgi:hypothetical protein